MENRRISFSQLVRMVAVIAVPVALQNLLTSTGSMVDTIMLASLGEKTVGAVGLCAQYTTLMFTGYWGVVGGGMMFRSQFWGAGDERGIRSAYGMTFLFMMASGLFFGGLAAFKPMFVMGIYTDSAAIREIGAEYLRIVGFALPLSIVPVAMGTLLRSIERVRIPLIGGIAGVCSNCLCNYILIFGKLGFPAMGVRGAAVGTLVSNLVNIGVVVTLVKIRKVPYVLEFSGHFDWPKGLLPEYLKRSAPIIANEVMIGIGNMMINIVLGHQIDEAIAATAVFRTLEGLVIGFFSGFSSAATVLVGKEVGAGNHEEAFQRAWRIIYLCCGMVAAVCLVLNLVHVPLLSLLGLSGESLRLASGMLLIYGIAGVIRMGNWAQNDTFRSAGESAYGSALEILFMFLMVQPAIHIANDLLHLPFLAVFALCYCDEPVRFFLMQRRMYSKRWIKPVSAAGLATIDRFREENGIAVKPKRQEQK